MFAILLTVSMFSQGFTMVSYGKSFITAFPEDLGYFYSNTSSRLKVTALYDGTSVDIFYNGSSTPTETISNILKGQTVTVVFSKSAEVYQLDYSTQSIRITSNKYIVVHSFSSTNFTITAISAQTNIVQPDENLGMNYLIPSLNYTTFLTTFGISQSTSWSPKYNSFRLIIINAKDTENNITIVKNISAQIQLVNFTIPSYQLIQLQADDSMMMVNSSHKIAVLLTHPCLDRTNYTCSMIINQILPVRFQGQNFVVPFVRGITQRQLFMTSNDKADLLSQYNTSLTPSSSGYLSLPDLNTRYVTASSNVSLKLIIPGLFIELIPENQFAACYMMPFYSNYQWAVVITKTDSRDQVRIGTAPFINPVWLEISNTQYSKTEIFLSRQLIVIWHPSSKIAVYVVETIGNTVFGGPAIPINEQPDPNGCMTPGEFVVGDQPLKWTESLAYCTNTQSQFACPINEDVQIEFIKQVNTKNVEGWIGLRRSLMTTAWYWQTNTTSASSSVNYIYWANGQPQDNTTELCASLSLNHTDDFKWKSAKCCEKKLPVCYKQPQILLPLTMSSTVYIP
ncbi:uncharacterized protein [Misgurnus anguillicaudatus]|uniref:uncharacterized protein n=1 Tax=Misgurnus anguillicaudatus TaxID=75329 RepID=UPI003CCF99CF